VPEELTNALQSLRPLLLDVDSLVRAVAAGRRRGADPTTARAELRPVDLKAGRHLQVTTTLGRTPSTSNHPLGTTAEAAVDALLAEPFGSWYVETLDRTVQLRVTKKGQAQVHSAATSRRSVQPGDTSHDRRRNHLLDPADPVFARLGAGADKRRQVDAFLRQLDAATGRFLAARAPGQPLRVVDLGCGNAYLTLAAHRWLSSLPAVQARGGVATVGIDVRPDMVARNTALAADLASANLPLPGLTFKAATIAEADPGLPGVDVVLALHACDTATDEALARAVRWRAPVILAAPCCHHDVQRQLAANRAAGRPAPHPYNALTRSAILRERLADVLTDALRADILRLLGYSVDVVEFVDSRHTPRNALLRARLSQTPPTSRSSAALASEYGDLVAAWGLRPALADLLAPDLAPLLPRLPAAASG
jgi:SAM-dependent methyltransferase